MTEFINFLNGLSSINENAIENLKLEIKIKTFEKGATILNSSKICEQLYFLEKGLVKLFFQNDEKEFIMRFFPENSMFTVLDSYTTKKQSTYSVVAIEPTTVFYISQSAMENLCKNHHCLETSYRKFVSKAAINMMNRISEMLEEDASKRYNNFIKNHNDLLQRISLGDLASYLGITQVSLSRIRAKK